MREVLPRSTGFCHYQLSIFSSDMASRSPAIFLLLALPLLCYVVSIEAHALPDDIVPDSRGLSDAVVPESGLDEDEMDEFMQATSRSDEEGRRHRRHCQGRRLLGGGDSC